jgi:hypothetical protein
VVGLSLVHRLGLGWDREDGGVNWTQIFDDQPVHSIGDRSAYSSWARLAAENASANALFDRVGAATSVQRLDRTGSAYFLVVLTRAIAPRR